MTRFHEHQAETLRIHQRYLETQERYSETFIQELGSAPVRPVNGKAAYAAPADLDHKAASRVMPDPVQVPQARPQNGNQPNPAAPVSTPKGSNGHSVTEVVIPKVVQPVVVSQPAPVVPPPAAAPAGFDREKLITALLQIVSDKTGYPVETLELDMDMEADLGIDSIKRVEILGAMQTQFPELPKMEAAVLAEQRTLGQIADQFGASAVVINSAAQLLLNQSLNRKQSKRLFAPPHLPSTRR